MKTDSIDKLVKCLGMICKKPFTYGEKVYIPKTMKLKKEVRNGFTCPANCDSCCGNLSLDYIPEENLKPNTNESLPPLGLEYGKFFIRRTVRVNGKDIELITDPQGSGVVQQTNKPDGCRYLNKDGRCDIHNKVLSGRYGQPFSCDFELIRFVSPSGQGKGHLEAKEQINNIKVNPSKRSGVIDTSYYKYARRMKDINGKYREDKPIDHIDFKDISVDERPGPKCEITATNAESTTDAIRKFSRMLEWADYLGIETWIPEMIDWIRGGSGEFFVINAKSDSKVSIDYTSMIPWHVKLQKDVLVEFKEQGLVRFFG